LVFYDLAWLGDGNGRYPTSEQMMRNGVISLATISSVSTIPQHAWS
jgi:hypothetical protein